MFYRILYLTINNYYNYKPYLLKKLILLFLFIPIVSFGQDTIPETKILTQKKVSMKFNHQALLVNDLNLSGDFYRDVLGLEEIEVGAGQNPPKRWFKNNQGIEMHLISSEEKLSILPKGIHMAFTVKNFDEFINHLKNKNIKFSNWKGDESKTQIRNDGYKQIFFQDPQGYWIEVNNVN